MKYRIKYKAYSTYLVQKKIKLFGFISHWETVSMFFDLGEAEKEYIKLTGR
jgi:hypothetical protein